MQHMAQLLHRLMRLTMKISINCEIIFLQYRNGVELYLSQPYWTYSLQVV